MCVYQGKKAEFYINVVEQVVKEIKISSMPLKTTYLKNKEELMEWVIYMYGKEKEIIEMIKEKNKDIREIDEEVKRIKKSQEQELM